MAKCIARDIGLFRGPIFGYPPVILWEPVRFERLREAWTAAILGRREDAASHPMGVFVNIPFCSVQCGYCDYVTKVGTADSVAARYPQQIKEEIDLLELPDVTMDSLYLSGGNVALFPPRQLDRLLSILHAKFAFAKDATRNVGLSHTPVSRETAEVFSRWGIKGAVIQVQTLDPNFSRRIQRPLDPQGFARTCEQLRWAGISYLKVDWMVGLPEQPMEVFMADLEEILRSGPDEVLVTPFHPGRYAPLWSLRNSDWHSGERLLESANILQRSEKVRVARQRTSIYHQLRGGAGARQEVPPSRERMSTLGLGYGAMSHIYGRLKYTRFTELVAGNSRSGREGGFRGAYGIAMSLEREKRRYVIERLSDRGEVDGESFEKVFGASLSDAFGHELKRLSAFGYLVNTPTGWQVPVRTRLYQSIVASLLYERNFKSWFQKRRDLCPERYAGVERNLVEIYDH